MSRIDFSQKIEEQLTRHTIMWKITNFLSYLINNKSNEEIHSSKCNVINIEDSQKPIFQFKVRFCGRNNDIIEVYFISSISVVVKTTLTFYFHHSVTATNEYRSVCADTWQYLTSLYKSEFTKFTPSSDAIALKFEFTVINGVIAKPIEEDNTFTNSFEDLFISGLYSDIVMKSADNVEYKVHKAVLASRSAVLKAHFEHNTTECHTNIVNSPLESDVLKEVLTFIYSDKAPRIDDMPEKLLAAADYYQLGKLKKLASRALHEKLTVDNAIETLQLADLYSVPDLKKWTLEYIKNGYASSLTGTESWAKLNSVELTKKLFEYITTSNVVTQ